MTESTPTTQPETSRGAMFNSGGTPPEPPRSGATADEIEADIAASRERLSSSVEDLVDAVNIPGRVKQKAYQATGQAKQATASLVDRLKDLPPAVLLASGGVLAALVVFVIIKRRR